MCRSGLCCLVPLMPYRSDRMPALVIDVASEYRIRRAEREMAALDEPTLRDLGLDRGGLEHAARFGRA